MQPSSQLAQPIAPENRPARWSTAIPLRVERGATKPPATPVAEWRRGLSDATVRVLNVLVAIIGLVVTAPVFVLIGLAVRLTSSGPVFYTQPRVGIDRRRGRPTVEALTRRKRDHGGRIFKIYKFRTMAHRAQAPTQVWATPEDPRITPVGRVLRRYRLDELPQLWNVLKGDMNIVGPRPEQPEIFKNLRRQVAAYQRRQRVLPGITGLAQVSHHYDQSIDDVKTKVQYDLEYIHRRSLVEDLRIMARTLPVMVGKKGSI